MAPLTSAEKQKRFKEKLKKDPEKYEEYKKKQRENYHAKKRLVKDLTPQEHYNAKVIWKLRKKYLRQKRNNLNRVLDNTPPSSPVHVEENILQPADMQHIEPILNQVKPADQRNPVHQHNNKKRGRKNVRRDRSKLYRDNLKLKKENDRLKQAAERYKKRYIRIKKHTRKPASPEPTDEVKYKKLTNAIKDRYQKITNNRERRAFKKVFKNISGSGKAEIIKESLGIEKIKETSRRLGNSATELKKTIDAFFVRDDISRQTAGKKETVTKASKKIQKRFLLDSMKNLHRVFKKEHPSVKCSYYYFTKHKPFFVVKPSVDGREMCLCKVHVNPVYKAQALKRKRVIATDDLGVLISSTVCDDEKQACMYGTCHICGHKNIGHDSVNDTEKIKWFEWTRTEVSYEKNGKMMKAFKNVKQEREEEVKTIMELFNQDLKTLKKHMYNIKQQHKSFRQAVEHLQETEMVLVADFSENYSCKYSQEIQAHHFGGSRQQVSLHTVVVYLYEGESKRKVQSYCTVSASLCHQPAAIWAHLHPILRDVRLHHPQVKTVHFFSDGPFSQYRQKQNFFLASTKPFDYGFTEITWSFFEAGHGKGPADGVGGFLKRTADNIVATGKDIPDAEQFYEALKDKSKVKLYLILANEIDSLTEQMPRKIVPLKGTLHVHQLFTSVRCQLQYRNLSCFCKRGFCQCLNPKPYHPIDDKCANDADSTNNIPDIDKDDSEDDVPLSVLRSNEELRDIDITDLCRPRNNTTYSSIYEDGNEPSTSVLCQDKENRPVQCGDYLLVNVHATKGKLYRYACRVNHLDDDGEITVTFLRSVKKKNVFRLDAKDMSCIDYTDIVKILPEPMINMKRGQQYLEFNVPVDIYEN